MAPISPVQVVKGFSTIRDYPMFYVLGTALIAAAIMGFIVEAPTGGKVAGFMAAGALWLASGIAVHRDWLARRQTPATV